MNPLNEIESLLPPDTTERFRLGDITFYADTTIDAPPGDVWFRARGSDTSFCRDEDGWYCTTGGGRGKSPREALLNGLRRLAREAKALLGGDS